jgi:hypothetical protein
MNEKSETDCTAVVSKQVDPLNPVGTQYASVQISLNKNSTAETRITAV